MKPKKRCGTKCVDCRTETLPTEPGLRAEWYIVRDELWETAGMTLDACDEGRGCLCIGCLETRLGRQLTPADFEQDIPINDPDFIETPRYAWTWRTPRLKPRLTGTALNK